MDDKDKNLANFYTFNVSVKGTSGKTYEGTFTMHRPTIGELSKMDIIESRELGGMKNVSRTASNLARILSVLDVVVDSAPEWWKPRELEDLEVMQAVYEKYVDYLRGFQGISGFEGTGKNSFYYCGILV